MTTHPWVNTLVAKMTGRVIAGWKVKAFLGSGHSGVVFATEKDGKYAAIKIYRSDGTIEPEELTDQRIARQLTLRNHNCPSLVGIIDAGADCVEGTRHHWVVMDRVPGRDLSKLNEGNIQIPPDRIGPLLSQLAQAAEYLEAKGFSHRDIKPANVMIDDSFRRAVLLDIGLIRETHAVHEQGSAISPPRTEVRYNAPEQQSAKHVQHPTADGLRAIGFYQLGCVLWEMTAGRKLFVEIQDHDENALRTATLAPPTPLSGVEPKSHLSALYNACMTKDPQSRLAAVLQLARDRGVPHEADRAWCAFDCPRGHRKPRIVFLYGGGTIGSGDSQVGDHSRVQRTMDSPDDSLLCRIARRVVQDYEQIYRRTAEPSIQLDLAMMPVQHQILSENATPETWNALVETIASIAESYSSEPCAETDHYLAGIVVLHGTDTLAYSAAAISAALTRIPCPVILTGSNQPPNEQDITERNFLESDSDAWRNMLRSVHYLLSLGHRYPGVFVCFGDTIHHGINIRKVPVDAIPTRSEVASRAEAEPFAFRNMCLLSQYMFKCIDGSYCNNFFPIGGRYSHDSMFGEPDSPLHRPWEARQKAICPSSGKGSVAIYGRFGESVCFEKITPAQELVASLENKHIKLNDRIKAILVEGYSSATCPTTQSHGFARVLAAAQRSCIPVILVSPTGSFPEDTTYVMHKIDGREVHVIRLYRIIAESALPLVNLIMGQISAAEWAGRREDGKVRNGLELLAYRAGLVTQHMKEYFERSPMWKHVLGNVSDCKSQRTSLTEARNKIALRGKSMDSELNKEPQPPIVVAMRQKVDSSWVRMSRHDFLWFKHEYTRSREVIGAGPDSFALHTDMGFDWARRLLGVALADDRNAGIRPFNCLSGADQAIRWKKARRAPWIIARVLAGQNFSAIKTTALERIDHGDCDHILLAGFRFGCEITRVAPLLPVDQMFGVQANDSPDMTFLSEVAAGAATEESIEEYRSRIASAYRSLYHLSLRHRVSVVDWFMLGAFRAAAWEAARSLLIDRWTQRCEQATANNGVEALRMSIHVRILESTKTMLRYDVSYRARRDDCPTADHDNLSGGVQVVGGKGRPQLKLG